MQYDLISGLPILPLLLSPTLLDNIYTFSHIFISLHIHSSGDLFTCLKLLFILVNHCNCISTCLPLTLGFNQANMYPY